MFLEYSTGSGDTNKNRFAYFNEAPRKSLSGWRKNRATRLTIINGSTLVAARRKSERLPPRVG